jgi:hypothetical protein
MEEPLVCIDTPADRYSIRCLPKSVANEKPCDSSGLLKQFLISLHTFPSLAYAMFTTELRLTWGGEEGFKAMFLDPRSPFTKLYRATRIVPLKVELEPENTKVNLTFLADDSSYSILFHKATEYDAFTGKVPDFRWVIGGLLLS